MNYKKSVLSLVTILALNSTVSADPDAVYVPLSNETNDNAWIMFGVNDFGTGIATAPASAGAFSSGYSVVAENDTSDDLVSPSKADILAATNTFPDSGNVNMATYQALKDSSGSPLITTGLELAIKTSDLTYSETQPIRSMYIAIEGAPTISKIKLNYKSTLEGREIEIQLGGTGAVYRTNISETATFNSPAVAKDTAIVVTGVDLTKPEEALAYDLSASPILASAYSKADHQFDSTGAANGAERFYNYDAENAQWVLWDRTKVAAATNSITEFEKGKAYWARMDTNGLTGDSNPATSATKAGLYLGKTGLKEADSTVYTGELTSSSWNMVAFDPADHPDMRVATTGLRVTTNALAATDAIDILDETGVNSVSVVFTAAAVASGEAATKFINETIEAAKMLGTVPSTFNVKAFMGNADTDLIFLSDKQFTLQDKVGDALAGAVTLAGVNAVVNYDGSVAAVADIGTGADQANTGATSVYGEYAMIIEPLVGPGSASNLDAVNVGAGADGGGSVGSASVQFGNIDGDSTVKLLLGADDTATDVSTAQATFVADEVFDSTKSTGTVLEIDTDFDGATDMLVAASDKSFYIKDNTFTRVYTLDTGVDGTGTGGVSFNISPADVAVTPSGALIAAVEADINTVADDGANDTEVYAASSGANTLITITKSTKVFELEDANSATVDYFSRGTLDADIAKGAVKRVVNISDLVRENLVTNKFEFTFTTDANGVDGGLGNNAISINGNAAADTVIGAATNTDLLRIAMLDSLVDEANTVLKTNNIAAFASHNYVNGYDDITKATITIEGVGITAVTFAEDDGTLAIGAIADANVATAGTINVDGALIVSDLKANAVYTPDYVNYGPLYTMKSAGYEAKAIIRASTKLANTPTTHWDHIDLTRESKDWLKNNEFNLFSVNNEAGYWVYAEDYTAANDIADGTTVWTPSFAHHFNTKTGATENLLNSATFSVEISDASATGGILDEETSNAKLIISGNEVQLTKTGTTFSAVLTDPETTGLTTNSGSDLAIALKAADGLGESYTNSALVSFDYDEPAEPTVSFTNGALMAFTNTSADVASYYLWEDYVPDDGASPIETNLLAAAAGSYNICAKTAFAANGAVADAHSYKLVAFDGTGIFGKANASNIKGFTYVNTLSGATVLTHSNGDITSTVASYDTACAASATPVKSGVEVKSVQVGTVRMAYVPIAGTINNKDDLPYTAYYDIPSNAGVDAIEVNILAAYANARFYVQIGAALYEGTFPANQAAADGSFSAPLNLTAVTAENQQLLP